MKKKLRKVICLIGILISILFCTNYVDAYNAEFYCHFGTDGEMSLNPSNTDTCAIYRTFVSAHSSSINFYNNTAYKRPDGWAYSLDSQNSFLRRTTTMPDGTSFRSSHVIIHPELNTWYPNTGMDTYYKYSSNETGVYNGNTLQTSAEGICQEGDGYAGFYSRKASSLYGQNEIKGDLLSEYDRSGIVSIPTKPDFGGPLGVYHEWRMHVNGSTYVADNVIGSDKMSDVMSKFPGRDRLYISNVTYTSKVSNIDTAYKFKTKLSWWGGDTIDGGSDGKDSFINYYDNILVLPQMPDTKVYIRHIDATNMDSINWTNIQNQAFSKISYDNTGAVNGTNSWTVGYLKKNGIDKVSTEFNFSYPEMSEYLKLGYNDIGSSQYNIYNKLYDNESKLGEWEGYQALIDNGTFDQYDYIGYYMGQEDNEIKAIEQLKSKYDNGIKNSSSFAQINSSSSGKCIIIDFLYKQKPSKKVFVRHVDITDVNTYSSNLANNIGTAAWVQSHTADGNPKIRTIQNVGFIDLFNKELQFYQKIQNKEMITPDRKVDPEYEYFEIPYSNIINPAYAQIYNKLFSSDTKSSILGDTTDYSEYTYVGYQKGVGNDEYSAVNSRNKNINDLRIDKSYNSVSIRSDWLAEEYIFLDFYYKKEPPPPPSKTKILVRHINISDINSISDTKIYQKINSGVFNIDYFNGYRYLTLKNSNGIINTDFPSLNRAIHNGKNYNEIYTVDMGTQAYLNSEFYNNTSTSYKFIGYIQRGSLINENDAISIRDNAINKNQIQSKDGNMGENGRIVIDTSTAKCIVVDMYYVDTASDEIYVPPVMGRLTYNSKDSQFADTTDDTYDYIPSEETLYASITNAYRYMLGGIRIAEKNITGIQKVRIKYNQAYKYSYEYWDHNECDICDKDVGFNTSHSKTKSCPEGEKGTCYDHKDSSVSRVYESNTVEKSYSHTTEYNIEYKYKYYKVQNIRTYVVKNMNLFDDQSTYGLPLFDGLAHTIEVTNAYKQAISSAFKQSFNYQELYNRNSEISSTKTENGDIEITVTGTTKDFGNIDEAYSITGDDKYTGATDKADDIETNVTNKANELFNQTTGATISDITFGDAGKSATPKNNNNYKLKLYVASDAIQINGDNILSKTKSAEEATKTIELKGKSSNKSNNNTEEVYVNYPDKVQEEYAPNGSNDKTKISDFKTDDLNIPLERVNGERVSKAKINYELTTDPILSFDVSNISANHAWNKTNRTTTGNFEDTEMKKADKSSSTVGLTRINVNANLALTRTYDYKSSKTSTAPGTGDVVNVFTPVRFTSSITNLSSTGENQIVNHTDKGTKSGLIQKGTQFTITITPKTTNNTVGHESYSSLQLSRLNYYIREYYVTFDFDVENVYINGSLYRQGAIITQGTWIGPIKNLYGTTKNDGNTTISAVARKNSFQTYSVMMQETNSYSIRGVAKNAPQTLIDDVATGNVASKLVSSYGKSNIGYNKLSYGKTNNIKRHYSKYYSQNYIFNDNDFVAQLTETQTENINRLYDFKITDLRDVDWKDTFRKSNTANTTNVHSGIVYYSGINKLNIYSTDYNSIISRTSSEIGSVSERILPLGPYKNIDKNYNYAPKLGYKFSFDFKTTGKIQASNKTAVIDVSFYYLSNDIAGKNSTQFNIDKNEDKLVITDKITGKILFSNKIDLYFKNNSNNYKKLQNSNNYNIYYVPNDGYRLTLTEDTYRFATDGLSNKTLKLGNLLKLNFNKNMRATSDNEFLQIWYGEYKLPNSTIVVETGETDLNKKLTNGYIGVVFDITVNDNGSKIKYSNNDMALSSSNRKNTSQWDYEGYLGLKNPGKEVSSTNPVNLTLGNGTGWKIEDDYVYNKLKGTVILYDTDKQASSDYQ